MPPPKPPTIEARVAALETAVAALQTSVTALRAADVNTTTQIENVEADVAALGARVATLEAAQGGEITLNGYTVIPETADQDGLQSTIKNAAPGDTLILPNKNIDIVAGVSDGTFGNCRMQLHKPITISGHPGGLSKLTFRGGMEVFGSGVGIFIGAPDVTLKGFEIAHDRSDPTQRIAAIWCWTNSHRCRLLNLKLTNITSDCFHFRGDVGQLVDGLLIDRCTVNEWYESFFIFYMGALRNCSITNCYATLSVPNPNSGVSRPYAIALDVEGPEGQLKNFTAMNNVFDASASDFSAMGNSLGFVTFQNGATGPVAYENITLEGNIFKNFYYGAFIRWLNNNGTSSRITLQDNKIENPIAQGIRVVPESGVPNAGDLVSIIGNRVVSDESGPAIDLTYAPNLTVIDQKNVYGR